MNSTEFLAEVAWNEQGLAPAIAQDVHSGQVLMMAWMSPESLRMTAEEGFAVYWSRSRQSLWKKGEQSGNQQIVHEIQIDCDGDTILIIVEQIGGIACHTGREHCFYRSLKNDNWEIQTPVLKDPAEIYGE